MTNSQKIALKIETVHTGILEGKLKRSARDMLSGLVIAYGLVIDEANVHVAFVRALDEASRYHAIHSAR